MLDHEFHVVICPQRCGTGRIGRSTGAEMRPVSSWAPSLTRVKSGHDVQTPSPLPQSDAVGPRSHRQLLGNRGGQRHAQGCRLPECQTVAPAGQVSASFGVVEAKGAVVRLALEARDTS
jgi:hypothetical protein